MTLIDSKDEDSNWSETLDLWSRVVNWGHYLTSESQLRSQIKTLLVYMWNEKDWLKTQHPSRSKEIKKYVSNSKYICVLADLANTVKHRNLTTPHARQQAKPNTTAVSHLEETQKGAYIS
ncbi:hypothetical protein [Pseudomonas leptonychotis]|uniref:hypothetical protein n=1 Tax=Pseudomonas leptonychotis TaxID=2448482 RepID=UPI0010AAA3C0|nr:hypothetical protein [Pseudomonas leptonychotis]